MHQTIKLDTRKREGKYGEARIAPLRRGERNNAMLTVKVGANGQPYDLSGKTASLVATTAAGKLVGPCPMQVAEAGIARIMLPAALYSAVGAFSGYVEIREGETLVDTTDSFGGKVIECADLDSEQAAEFTPLLGEVRDATVKALESRIIHAEVETLDPGSDATASLVPEDGAQCLRLGIPRGDTGAKGDKGEKGDPFTYDDFTEAQILELQRPATEAAASVDAINVIAPKTVDTAQAASAAYKNSLAIGEGAKCTSDKYTQLAIGAISKTQGANAISVGLAAEADGPASVSMGLNAHSEGGYSVAIGTASAANGERSKAFGDYAQSIGNRTDALSSTAYCVGNTSQALGYQSSTCATQSAAIGTAATVNGASVPDPAVKDFKASTMNSVALGSFSVADEQNTVSVGNDVASITKYRRKSDGTGKLTETAPFWETRTVNLPASAQHLKRRITNVADPIDGHNAATKNYVDSNTCNVLIGSETGAVAHVEDAFNGASLRKIVVEGAAKQDGIPSPESPKPITVIEHPTVKVVGRNLWPFASSYTSIEGHQNEFVKEGTPFALLPGAYTFSAVGSLGNTDAPLFGYTATGKRFQFFRILKNTVNPKYSFTVTEPITSIYFVSNAADSNTGTISNIQLERDSEATEYKPYTSASLTFALPAEHPYLAKLPDGTADEIVVDEEGNVELVARVARMKVPDSGFDWNIQEQPGGFSLGYADSRFNIEAIKRNLNAAALMCDKFMSKGSWENKPCFGVSGVLWVVPRTNQGDITSKDVAAVANGMVFYAPLVTSVTYPLGKIDMPKAQDSIINAWTDAEVTPNTGISYVRDVNIVVAHLESAIASITEG